MCIPSYSYGAEVTKAALGGIEENANVVTDVSIPGSRTWYGTCATAAGTQQKTVTTATGDFVLTTGARVVVKFSNSNTHGSPTLKVDSASAKALYSRTTYPVSYYWNASEMVCFVYDGTRFVMEVGGTATTTYYGRTKLYDGVDSSSSGLAATAASVKTVNDSLTSKTALSDPSDTHGYYILGNNVDKRIASYDFVTNALASSGGGADNYHINSYVMGEDPANLTFAVTNGSHSYSFSDGRLTWLFDGSSETMQSRPAPGDYTIVVSSPNALTGISGDRRVSHSAVVGTLPLSDPISISVDRLTTTSWRLTAHVAKAGDSFDASDGYYAYIDGFVANTYDKPGYVAYSVTNDAAAIVSFVDTVNIAAATNGNDRIVANAEAVRRYTREQIVEAMKTGEFWHYSPAGKISADPSRVIIDQEVMFMGRFTYLTAGGVVAISADEGVSQVSTTGSVFRIGMFGNRDIEISGDERQLHINSFELDQANNRWVIKVSTAFMENPNVSPVIRTVTNLNYIYDGTILWSTLELTGTKSGDEWTFYVPDQADDRVRFFSAWAIQGEKKVHIGPKLELGSGQIVIDGNVYAPIEIVIGSTTIEVLGRVKP